MANTMPSLTPAPRALIWAFAKAVAAGSLAGAGPMMLLTVPLGLFLAAQGTPPDILVGLKTMFLPLMVSTPVVLGSSVLIGVPTFLILRHRNLETQTVYAIAGTIMGAVAPVIMNLAMGGEAGGILLNLGALAGGVTGWSWWYWGRRPFLTAQDTGDLTPTS